MRVLLRVFAAGMYAYGGWSLAVGIRQGDDPAMHLGLGLLGAGLGIELGLNLWRAAVGGHPTGDASRAEPGAAADPAS
jgi:hypothetical protein